MNRPTIPIKAAFGAAIWLASASNVFGANPETVPGTDAPNLFSAAAQMIGVMIVLLAGLFLLVYILRRMNAAKRGLFGGSDMIRIIATRALAPKKYITLVEIGGSVLTLGVCEDGISCLDKTPAQDFKRDHPQSIAPAPGQGFAERLKSVLGSHRSGSPE